MANVEYMTEETKAKIRSYGYDVTLEDDNYYCMRRWGWMRNAGSLYGKHRHNNIMPYLLKKVRVPNDQDVNTNAIAAMTLVNLRSDA